LIPNDDKISSSQIGNFIFLTVLGIGILSLPSALTKSVDNDGWILVIISGGLSMISLFVICKIGERHASLGFLGTLRFLFGKIFGTMLAIPVLIYAFWWLALEFRFFGEVTKLYLLHKTPLEFIILPIMLLAVILVRGGIEPITRSFGIFLPIIILVILILVISSFQGSDLSNLRPLLSTPISKYLKGLSASIYAYSGYEFMLVMFPFVREPKKAFKATGIAMLFIIVLYAIITIECIAKLGTEETKSQLYPVMALIKSANLPGGFIESGEGLMSSLWVVFAFTSIVAILYFLSVLCAGVFNHKTHKHFASLSMPIVYILALQGNSITDVYKFADVLGVYLGTYTISILPTLMIIVSLIKGKKAS
jgi:spore germination protein